MSCTASRWNHPVEVDPAKIPVSFEQGVDEASGQRVHYNRIYLVHKVYGAEADSATPTSNDGW